jgi:ubiquinol-cytochrome c reductase cytochrome c subunit
VTQTYRSGQFRIKEGVTLMAKRGLRRRLGMVPTLLRIPLLAMLISSFAAGQRVESSVPPDGAAIFAQRCAMCHGERGQGIAAFVSIAGPSLQAEHDTGRVMTAVESGPSHMPAFSRVLSVPQIRAVSYYVSTQIAVIPLTGGDVSDGGKLFRVYCATCHRTAVRGGALAFAGRNAPALTNKSAALVAGAIRWGPGTMPAFPPAVLDDRQLASVVQYVKFVQHPPDPGGNPLKYYGPVSEGLAGAAALLVLVGVAGWIERGGKG